MKPDLRNQIQNLYDHSAPPLTMAEIDTIEVGAPPRAGWLAPAFAITALVAVVASAALLFDGTAPPPADGDDTERLIRVQETPGEGGMAAIVTGVVEVDLELGCVWLADDGGGRYPVVWPMGTTAIAEPFTLTFASGATAGEGDRVTGGGGYVPAATAVDDPFPEACLQTGDAAVFNADSEIEVEEGVGVDQPDTLYGRFTLPEAIGFELISVNPNARSIAVSDFVTGTIHLFQPEDYASPPDAISGASGGGGFIHVWANGTIRSYPGTLDAEPVVYQPQPLVLHEGAAPTLELVPVPDGERVWLVQDGVGLGPTTVELVNLVEVEVTRLGTSEIDGSWQPAGATIDGLVLNSTDGGAAILVGYDGAVLGDFEGEAISVGWQSVAVIDADGDLVVTDSTLGNPTMVARPEGEAWVGIGGPAAPAEAPPVVTGGERLLVGLAGFDTVGIVVIEPSGEARPIYVSTGGDPIAAWTRAGDWVVVVEGSEVTLVRLATGETFDLGEIIPPDHWMSTAG